MDIQPGTAARQSHTGGVDATWRAGALAGAYFQKGLAQSPCGQCRYFGLMQHLHIAPPILRLRVRISPDPRILAEFPRDRNAAIWEHRIRKTAPYMGRGRDTLYFRSARGLSFLMRIAQYMRPLVRSAITPLPFPPDSAVAISPFRGRVRCGSEPDAPSRG